MVGLCKHLTAVLSNKRWLQQVTSRFVDWLIANLDDVNKYLRLQGDKQLTAPNAEARALGKKGSYKKWIDRVDRINDVAEEYLQDRKDFIEHNEDRGILEDIKRWLNDNYKIGNYDYVRATPEELNAILLYVTKDRDNIENNEGEGVKDDNI